MTDRKHEEEEQQRNGRQKQHSRHKQESHRRKEYWDTERHPRYIGECIRRIAKEVGIGGRESYVALYWVIISRSYGPTVAPLMAEMEKESLIGLLDAFTRSDIQISVIRNTIS